MNYKDYSIEDLIKNEKFINWIKTDDPSLNTFWEEWILLNPERKQDFLDARTILLNLNFNKDELTSEEKLELWDKIDQQTKIEIPKTNMVTGFQNENDNTSFEKTDHLDYSINDKKFEWRKLAAAIIILFTVAGFSYYLVRSNEQLPINLTVVEIVKQNPKGQKLTTYLPDGSKVILNSLSEIRYKSTFIGDERVVELKGEAFFEVKKNASKPFKVISDGVTTIALGTSFNVNSKNKDYVEVALVTGKVSVENAFSTRTILTPGKSAIINIDGKLMIQDFNYLEKAGWKDGILVFNNASFSQIVKKLEDWYGVELNVVGGQMNQIQYTSNFKNESLNEILEGISFVYNFKYKIEGKKVNIYANK